MKNKNRIMAIIALTMASIFFGTWQNNVSAGFFLWFLFLTIFSLLRQLFPLEE